MERGPSPVPYSGDPRSRTVLSLPCPLATAPCRAPRRSAARRSGRGGVHARPPRSAMSRGGEHSRPAAARRRGSGDLELGPGGGAKAEQRVDEGSGGAMGGGDGEELPPTLAPSHRAGAPGPARGREARGCPREGGRRAARSDRRQSLGFGGRGLWRRRDGEGWAAREKKKQLETERRGILVFSLYPLTDLLGRLNSNDIEGMENYKRWHRRDELISNGT